MTNKFASNWFVPAFLLMLGALNIASGAFQPRPPVLLSLKDAQLVAQGEDLELELSTGPKPVSYDHGQKS